MEKTTKQTWWDNEIKTQFKEFESWVGSSSSKSKKFMRDYIAGLGHKSIIDIGCGICDDYFAYKKEYPDIKWTGVDSSAFLIDKAQKKKSPVLYREAHNTKLADNMFDVAYSRHVLEHQESYKPILTEMIRIASKMVTHIFFIPPREKEIIHWNEETNLYHNTFIKKEIEKFLYDFEKVTMVGWTTIGKTEEALIILLKTLN